LNKTYNGTTNAPLSGAAALPAAEAPGSGTTSDGKPYTGDTVNASGTASGAFIGKNAGTAVAVIVSGLGLSGAQAGDYVAVEPAGLSANIAAKALTVAGLSASNKTYDATSNATLTGTGALQSAESAGTGTVSDGKPYTIDTVSLSGTPTGTFASKDVASGVNVFVSGFTLGGAQAANYVLSSSDLLTANITAKTLTVSGVSAGNKIYDGTTSAALSGTAALQATEAAGAGATSDGKPYTGDTLTLNGSMSGAFSDKNAGTGKTITVTGLTLGGTQAGDYALGGLAVTANITAKALTISGVTAGNKTYDGTTTAPLGGTAALSSAETAGTGSTSDGLPYTGDVVSAAGTPTGVFGSKDVGTSIGVTVSGVTLSGAQASNYSAIQPTGVTANITAKALTVSGLTAAAKVYDATTTATLSGSAALPTAETAGTGTTSDGTPYTGDTVALSGAATGAFAAKDVGTAVAVTVSGLILSGAQAGDYTLSAAAGLTANITTKTLTASGMVTFNKTYDGTTSEPLGGSITLLAAEAPGTGTASDGAPYTGDTVSENGIPNAAFASQNAGTGIAVIVTGLSLTGAQAGDYSVVAPAGLTANITAKALKVGGLSASNKTYDGTLAATLTGTGVLQTPESAGTGTFVDGKPYTGDAVSLSGTPSGAFASKDVGNAINVYVTGFTLGGAQVGNYVLYSPELLTANIAAKTLTVSGVSASNKIYDGATTVALSGTAALQTSEAAGAGATSDGKPYTGDTVSLSGSMSGAFSDKNAGTGKTITVTGLALGGAQAGDYVLGGLAVTANITAKALTILGVTASNKTYDGMTAAPLGGTAALSGAETAGTGSTSDGLPYTGDAVSAGGTPTGVFASKDVANAIAITVGGVTLSGAQASNYSAIQPTGLTANIIAKALTVSGLTAANKIYDATTTATLNGTGALQTAETAGTGTTSDGTPYTGDTVALGGTAAGAFAAKDVGAAVAVTVTGLTLSGAQAGDYTLTAPAGLTANITAKSIALTGLAAVNKTYDGTTNAPLSGAGALPAPEAPGTGTTSDGKPYTGDTVNASGTASGAFISKNAGTGVAVIVSGLGLSGAQAGDYVAVEPAGLSANITAKALTVAVLSASNKTYDATSNATLTGTGALQSAESAGGGTVADGKPYTGDAVSLTGTPSGTFASKDVATAINVFVSGFTLGGAQSTNYVLSSPELLTANITAKTLIVSGLAASNKTYDGTTAATLTGGSALQPAETPGAGASSDGSPYSGDAVSLSGTASGTFASQNASNGVAVTVSGLSLSGAKAGDYLLPQPAGLTANIAAKTLTVSGVAASSKTYDGTTIATLTGTPVLQASESVGTGTGSDGKPYTGDSLSLAGTASGSFATKTIGTALPVTVSGLSLSGAQAANYSLAEPSGLAASVTAKGLTVSGLVANNKVYDGTISATLNTSGAALVGVVSGDSIMLSTAGAVATFASASAGNQTVVVAGLTLGGADSGNYTLTQPTLTATIAKANAIVALSGLNQTYTGSALGAIVTTTPLGLATTIAYSGPSTSPINAGTYVVTATVTDPNYAGSATGSLIIAQAGQTINFTPLSGAKVGVPVTLSATATSGLPVSLSLVSGNATLSGTTLTIQDTNSVVVQASQAGNANYTAAASISMTVSVGKQSQTVTFNSLPNVAASVATVALVATASSGLPVTFTVISGPAAVSGSTLTLTGTAGQVAVLASQAGNATFMAASATQSFSVTVPGPQVYFGQFSGSSGSQAAKGMVPAATGSTGLAAYLNANGTGTLIGVLPGGAAGFVVNFTVGTSGQFTATAPELTGSDSTGPTLSFSGSFSGGTLTGSIAGLNLAFSLVVDPAAGASAGIAGVYQSSSLQAANGATYSVVGTQDDVFVLALAPNTVAAGTGTVSGTSFSVQASPAVAVTGSVNPSTTTITGTITTASGTVSTGGLDIATPPTDRLVNLSTLGTVGAGQNSLVSGFIIGGSTSKPMLLRGVGPGLSAFGLTGTLTNPMLQLYNSAGQIMATNVGWGGSASLATLFTQVGAFALAPTSADAVISSTLSPGVYTIQLSGANGGSGRALIEIYDATAEATNQYEELLNISSRGQVAGTSAPLTGGFIIEGNNSKQLLIRGVGPSLANFAITGVLADPFLTVLDSNGNVLAKNDNWSTPLSVTASQNVASASDIAAAEAAVGAFALANASNDAALIITLPPGSYTAQVSGNAGGSGIALVEIYEIPPPGP